MNSKGSTPTQLVLTTLYIAPSANSLIPTLLYLGF